MPKSYKAEIYRDTEMGVIDYLSKPCTVEELQEAIANRLEKKAAMKERYTVQIQPVAVPASTDTAKPLDNPPSIFPCDPLLGQVFQFIEANYDQPISLCDVAVAVGYCGAYLTDLVRRNTGKTVNHWIVERRMVAAGSLLLETDQCVNQIAQAVGYQHEGYFFRQFRQYHGTTPQAWRKTQRAKLEQQPQIVAIGAKGNTSLK